jgi:hypothetical protein
MTCEGLRMKNKGFRMAGHRWFVILSETKDLVVAGRQKTRSFAEPVLS